MEEERKWEELNRELLVEIFRRVESESLLESIQFVCKSWYQATIVPHCWETLVFPSKYGYSAKFIKTAVDRSQGTATHIKFKVETSLPDKALVYISEKCPALKTLHVCTYGELDECILTGDLICKWKNLEVLHISCVSDLAPILEPISIHCKNFVEFSVCCFIDKQASAAIVQFIPKIKYLKLSSALFLLQDCLVDILKGCKELELLDVSYCKGFDAHDAEILKLASHIPSFSCEGSYLHGRLGI